MATKPRRFDVCIIGGAGHVGLPLGVTMALGGLQVALLDINKKAIAQIKKGRFPFKEEDGDVSLRKALKKGTLTALAAPVSVIAKSDVVVVVIGTPVDEYLNPQFGALDQVIEKYLPHFRDGQTIMLRSTLFPGSAERLQRYFEKKKLKVSVAFCPERVIEGKAIREIQIMPQIISAFDKETLQRMKELFAKISKGGTVVAQPMEAELAKLYSNAWRYITFATANQFYTMATERGVDYTRIYRAMTDKYERMQSLPRPGFAAGPCLFKDTMQLAAFNQNHFFLGHSAMLVNEGLPRFIVEHIKHRLCNNDLHEKTIGILGMTFKADSDDTRDSLSFKLRKMAKLEAKAVYAHDFYHKDPSLSRLDALLKKSDIIIVATPHKRYAQIPKEKLKNKIIVDIWNHLPYTKTAIEL
ncbi:nucleotide sugar dehydrogenase [Candidatus Kaiserbacteria bacterium]|nr:nucleotide sugar dehydrogenase [Candidatus Kaiserbacteria bacterium]